MRVYESESERRCMIEYEYAMYRNWLLKARPLSPPRQLPFKGIETRAESRRRTRASDSECVPCRPIVSRCWVPSSVGVTARALVPVTRLTTSVAKGVLTGWPKP